MLAVPYITRFVIQLPLFLAGQVVWLGVAKVVLGWPLLIAALAGDRPAALQGQDPDGGLRAANRGELRIPSPPEVALRFGRTLALSQNVTGE